MLEVLALWGVKTVGKATWSFSKPILEAVATDVAKDTAKSYVGKCFKSVFSVIHREPLTMTAGIVECLFRTRDRTDRGAGTGRLRR
ncbi:MAG: hypothetical protein ACFB9N_08680 [Geitlerinemataceae cyanobacterium]